MFHHLFSPMKFCSLAAEVAYICFRPGNLPLDGDYTKAMSHTVWGATPVGWTPLHILCNGSDASMMTRDVIKHLLENDIVDIRAFDSVTNDKVIVFSLAAMNHTSTPSQPAPLQFPPSTPKASTYCIRMYVCAHVYTYVCMCRHGINQGEACVCIGNHVCAGGAYVCMFVQVCAGVNMCVHAAAGLCMCVHVCAGVCMVQPRGSMCVHR